ncbi:peptidoglycan recognition protein 6 [Salarias fasciatus]|nr:N-acetylmuramoyl-L-alanine amidase-like [Salarias fasciatus]
MDSRLIKHSLRPAVMQPLNAYKGLRLDSASTFGGCRSFRMDGGCWKLAVALMLLLLGAAHAEGQLSWRMEDFIRAVQQVEDAGGASQPGAVLRTLRRAAGLGDAVVQHFLGNAESRAPGLTSDLSDYVRTAVHHRVTEAAREEGVVLTPDGSTVALAPLLLGLEAGFRARTPGRTRGLLQLTLAKDLGVALSAASSASTPLASDGCWDNRTAPRVFTLSHPGAPLTAAQVNGAMDGVVLGTRVSGGSAGSARLSSLLTEYYCHRLDGTGMDGAPRFISRRRRENFKALAPPPVLTRLAVKAEELRRRLGGRSAMEAAEKRRLAAAVKEGMKEFVHVFMNCPPIVSRCSWGAAPYRGTPTQLSLPLSYLFIHHTASPSQPCLSFEQCAANMRSMQRFHQEDNGWDDIGYSFVAGSDGNIYEGRGWNWQGAHTSGYNSVGYGVSFIGDYTSRLPTQSAMALVRDQLAACAVAAGRLKSSYMLRGHRQMGSTTCPGDAFYQEIRRWDHFG